MLLQSLCISSVHREDNTGNDIVSGHRAYALAEMQEMGYDQQTFLPFHVLAQEDSKGWTINGADNYGKIKSIV